MANGISMRSLRREINESGHWQRWDALAQDIRAVYPMSDILIRDSDFWVVPDIVMMDIVQHVGAHKGRYVKERRDCDDFAGLLKYQAAFDFGVNSIGFVNDQDAGHAYCLMVCSNQSVFIVEPQSGLVVPSGTQMHSMRQARISF